MIDAGIGIWPALANSLRLLYVVVYVKPSDFQRNFRPTGSDEDRLFHMQESILIIG